MARIPLSLATRIKLRQCRLAVRGKLARRAARDVLKQTDQSERVRAQIGKLPPPPQSDIA